MSKRGSGGNVVAALCSFFLPGLGQLLQGNLLLALFAFVSTAILYWFWFLLLPLVPAVMIHLWSILNAALYDPDPAH